MKVAIITLVFALFSAALAAPLVAIGGTFDTTDAKMSPPTGSYPENCDQTSSQYYYASVNFTAPADGVYLALSYSSSVDFYLYNDTFTNTNSCINIMYYFESYGTAGISDYGSMFLQAGKTYWLAVFSSSATSFMLEIYAPNATGDGAGRPTWNPAYNSGGGSTCSSRGSSYIAPYVTYTWTSSFTGFVDIFGFTDYNRSQSGSKVMALYSGAVLDAVLTSPADACAAATFVYGYYDSNDLVGFYRRAVTNGQQYTAVLSLGDDDNEYAKYGFVVIPTRLRILESAPIGNTFTLPANNLPPCTAGSHTARPWTTIQFTPQYSLTWINVVESTYATFAPGFASFDAESALYSGDNTNPPSTCPIIATFVQRADSFASFINLTANTQYTFVMSAWGSAPSANSDAACYVNIVSGRNVKGEPGTSGAATTAAATTAAAATTGAATGATAATTGVQTTAASPATTGATTMKQQLTGTTSGASSLVASVLFLVTLFAL
jgi:hypothetical protein